MKKAVILILVMSILASALELASCTEKRKPNETDDGNGTAGGSDVITDNDWDMSRFDDIDIAEGTVVRIMSRAHQRHANEITVETEDGKEPDDFILASVYRRQEYVEEKLGVTIENYKVEETDEHGGRTLIQTVVSGNDDTYDIYASSYYGSSILATDGLFMNLYDVENLDTSRDYWSSYYIEKSQIGDKLYTITGDIATSATRFLFVTFFNKNLVNEYQIENPYDMVSDGTWTYDTMLNIVKDIYNDLNSDGLRDENDFYGLV